MNSIIKIALETAASFIGTKEESQNRGKIIDQIQQEMGFIGQPYCAIFVLYCFKKACEQLRLKDYLPETASSQTLFQWADNNKFIYNDPELLKPGDIVIWRKFKLWQGHAGLIISPLLDIKEMSFQTIEANTSNSDFGNQREGDGIYKRIRHANKIDFDVDGFYLRGFIDAEKIFSGEMTDDEFVQRLITNNGGPIPQFSI